MHVIRNALAVVAAVLLTTLLIPMSAHAAPGSFLRLAHLSPDTPAVDVTVTAFGRPDWSIVLKGVGYGDVSSYQRVEAGTYTVAMRPTGADPATPPVISATLDAADGRAYTVAGLGKFASLGLKVLGDEISLPPAGQARMRVLNAAPLTGSIAVSRAGTSMIDNAGFGQASDYVLVPSGPTVLRLTPLNFAPSQSTNVPVTLDAGGVYSVLVLEKGGVLSASVRQDAKGAEVVPAGPVETGLGGAAGRPGEPSQPSQTVGLALLVVAALASGGLAVAVRRRRIA